MGPPRVASRAFGDGAQASRWPCSLWCSLEPGAGPPALAARAGRESGQHTLPISADPPFLPTYLSASSSSGSQAAK